MKAILRLNEDSKIKIGVQSLLYWNLESLLENGVDEIFIVGKEKPWGILPSSARFIEDPDLGDGGLLSLFKKEIKSDFVYIPNPVFFDVDFKRALKAHRSSGRWISVFAGPTAQFANKRILLAGENFSLRDTVEANEELRFDVHNLVDLGIYIISRKIFALIPDKTSFSFFKDVAMPARVDGLTGIYRTSEYVREATDIAAIESAIRRGIPEQRNLKNPQKALFLDRDGTINKFGDFVIKPDMLSLMEDSVEAIRLIDDSPYIPICVTNQPIVARGEATLEMLDEIHAHLAVLLEKEGAYLQDVFFCPHNIDRSKEWYAACECRKPKIGMLLKAKERYNIDFASSWMIGDTSQDVQTGINAGCHTVLLHCGDPNPRKRFGDASADFEAEDLLSAVKQILSE